MRSTRGRQRPPPKPHASTRSRLPPGKQPGRPAKTTRTARVWNRHELSTAQSLNPDRTLPMTGTPSQVEWAERIKVTVGLEFERVPTSLSALSGGQTAAARTATVDVLAILEEKRAAVMSREDAGYFIRNWQELSDQVRKMIVDDPRYKAIRARKAEALRKSEK